ncbi:MAG: F0F1 ATP synthase subunit gamma, partial [Acidimicrobiales bacterium]
MAGGQERILRRRIKTVRATRKITKAMELIAASQIPRSQARIVANRPYRDAMRQVIIEAVKSDPAAARALLSLPERVEGAAVLVIAGDRGLSGAYNSSVLRAGERLARSLGAAGTNVRLYCV